MSEALREQRQAERRRWTARAERWGEALWRRAIAEGRPPAELRMLLSRDPGDSRASRWLESVALRGAEAAGRAWLDEPNSLAAPLARLRAAGGAPLLVVGDSHSRLHLRRGRRGDRFLVPVGAVLTGASARGLGAVASRRGHGARILSALEAACTAPAPPLLCVFGQVDVEFVHVFKRLAAEAADDDAVTFDAFATETVERYARWLTDAAARWPGPISVAPIFPPALSDAAWAQGYLDAHLVEQHGALPQAAMAERLARFRVAPLAVRTERHERFNARLRAALVGSRVTMAPGFTELQADGYVDPRFQGEAAGRDHHLDYAAVRAPVVERLWASLVAPGA